MITVVNNFFNNPVLRKLALRLRYPLVLLVLVVLAFYIEPQWLLTAFLVSMFGEAIQLWSFASLVKNEELTARGPYVLVRNPMYLGRFFLILGVVLLFGNAYITIIYTLLYFFYMTNRVQREERRLEKLLGDPYRQYQQTTNRFLPSLQKFAKSEVWYFNWRVLWSNNGHWNLLSLLVIYATIYAYVAFYLTAR